MTSHGPLGADASQKDTGQFYTAEQRKAQNKHHHLTIVLKSTPLRLTDILETFFFHLGIKYTGLSK